MKTAITKNDSSASWLWLALATFFLFGTTNFLLGFIAEKTLLDKTAVIAAPVLLWLGMGFMGIITSAVFIISRRGFVGIPAFKYAVFSAFAGVAISLGMLTLKIGFTVDPVSKGPIVAIASSSCMLVALLARFLLKEKLNLIQWTALGIIVAGIMVMALARPTISGIRGILFGLATLAFFGISNYILKFVGARGMNSLTASAILWLGAGVCGIIGLIVLSAAGQSIESLDRMGLKYIALVAGLFLGAGMLTLKIGVTIGKAGPVVGIAGANAVLVTLLDLIVFKNYPGTIKIAGMALALCGIIVLSRKS